jgi:predicted secreted acid phosphatase
MVNAYTHAYNVGVEYLKSIFIQPNYAVMFDIDDTLLLVNGNKLSPNKPIIKLLNYCIKAGLIIMIITARKSIYYEETVRDLERFGINYDILRLCTKAEENNILFKSNIKQFYLNNENIKTVMSVGDNVIDIIGEHSGFYIKLPER